MIKILVVDDEATMASQLEERLSRMGYEVTGKASSGGAAIELLKWAHPDLVLMDIVMEGEMDGINAAQVIRDDFDLPVVFLTGHAEDEFIEKAKAVEPFGYIIKPFREKELKATIDIAVYKKSIERLLRESEERFRAVADFTYDWEYWSGPDGEIIYTSPSCERITGYSPGEFADDPGLLEKIVHPDDHSAVANHFVEAEGLEKAHSIDFRMITRSGEERWISHKCQPVHSADGTYLGRRVSNRDISKRKNMWEEVLKAKKLESLGVLAGGIAHDFNNMLTVVSGKYLPCHDEGRDL